MYLFDTNTISYLFRSEGGVAARLSLVAPSKVSVPAPVLYESFAGIGRLPDGARRQALNTSLERLVATTKILPFDENSAHAAAQIRLELESRGALMGAIDIQIAGIAMAIDRTLVSRNIRKFGRVPGLRVENWFLPA